MRSYTFGVATADLVHTLHYVVYSLAAINVQDSKVLSNYDCTHASFVPAPVNALRWGRSLGLRAFSTSPGLHMDRNKSSVFSVV